MTDMTIVDTDIMIAGRSVEDAVWGIIGRRLMFRSSGTMVAASASRCRSDSQTECDTAVAKRNVTPEWKVRQGPGDPAGLFSLTLLSAVFHRLTLAVVWAESETWCNTTVPTEGEVTLHSVAIRYGRRTP